MIDSRYTYYPKVLIDQFHRQAWSVDIETATKINPEHPKDSSYQEMVNELRGFGYQVIINYEKEIDEELLNDIDLLVLPHNALEVYEKVINSGSLRYSAKEIEMIGNFVKSGGSLLVLTEYEIEKYGSNINELLKHFELKIVHGLVQDLKNSYNNVAAWVKPDCENGEEVVFYRAGWLEESSAQVIARSSLDASPAGVPMAVIQKVERGKVAVVTDSDFIGDDSINNLGNREFFLNFVHKLCSKERDFQVNLETPSSWLVLKALVEDLKKVQNDDGSVNGDLKEFGKELSLKIIDSFLRCAKELSLTDRGYIQATVSDFQRWVEEGLEKPDFFRTLESYRPELLREEEEVALILMPMYTQNGSSRRVFEAMIIKTVWPKWVKEVEREYRNPAFVPLQFIDFTSGYDTHSAVFFPETVSINGKMKFHWGGIFCDREAARFIKIAGASVKLLNINTTPELELFLTIPNLVKETFVLWDLVHDRTHSHGELPFDPFMIKQRNPYWMYSLEEMRCDLNAYLEMDGILSKGFPHARFVKYAVLLDRVLRFPVSGGRERNYDGLVGQIIFGKLHRDGALLWRDNKLSFVWDKVDNSIAQLCSEVNSLYKESIDKPKLSFWSDGYDLVRKYVEPSKKSNWSKGPNYHLESKELVETVLSDEFPLNMFYEALNKKLSGEIEKCKGLVLGE